MRINKGNWTGETATIAATGNKLRINGDVYTMHHGNLNHTGVYYVYPKGSDEPTVKAYNVARGDEPDHWVAALAWEDFPNGTTVTRENEIRNVAIAQLLFAIT